MLDTLKAAATALTEPTSPDDAASILRRLSDIRDHLDARAAELGVAG